MNKILLTGHLGADPALRAATNGQPYAHFQLATDEYWRDAKGDRQKRTEWHSVFFWGPRAESIPKYLHKGSKVLVEGRLESREDTSPKGESIRLWSVKAHHYELLDRREADSPVPTPDLGTGDGEDDIPL